MFDDRYNEKHERGWGRIILFAHVEYFEIMASNLDGELNATQWLLHIHPSAKKSAGSITETMSIAAKVIHVRSLSIYSDRV